MSTIRNQYRNFGFFQKVFFKNTKPTTTTTTTSTAYTQTEELS